MLSRPAVDRRAGFACARPAGWIAMRRGPIAFGSLAGLTALALVGGRPAVTPAGHGHGANGHDARGGAQR